MKLGLKSRNRVSLHAGLRGVVFAGVVAIAAAGPASAAQEPMPIPATPPPPVAGPPREPEALQAPAVPAAAAPTRELLGFSGDLSGYGMHHRDSGYKILGDRDDRIAGGLEASYDVFRLGHSGRLALGLGYLFDRVGPSANRADLQASFEGASYYALVVARWRQGSLIQPYLSAAGGLTHAEMAVSSTVSYAGDLRGQANAGFGRAAVGLRIVPGATMIKKNGRPILGFSLIAEAGGIAGGKVGFDLRPDAAPAGSSVAPGAPIAVEAVHAGDLGTTALYTRLGVGLVF